MKPWKEFAPIGKRVEVTIDGKVSARGRLRRDAGTLTLADEISGKDVRVPDGFIARGAVKVL